MSGEMFFDGRDGIIAAKDAEIAKLLVLVQQQSSSEGVAAIKERDQLRTEIARLRASREIILPEIARLKEALGRIANTYDESWQVGSQERRIGDLARAALKGEEGQ